MATDEEKQANKAQLDAAAEAARQEFMDNIVVNSGSWKDVVNWAIKHYPTAGYKRLGKVLVELGKNLNSGQASDS